MKNATKLIAMLLLVCMLLPVLASCSKDKKTTTENQVPAGTGEYTYKDAVVVMSNNWNPHTYQTTDESYPIDFITSGLYGFYFNDNSDEAHTVEGKDPYDGYVILPEMAASMPVDVTAAIKAQFPDKYNIPEGADAGYAYTIDLNPNAKWENGDVINADTYVWSMQQLLNPDYLNYRAVDYFEGDFAIANADKYYYQGTDAYFDNMLLNGWEMADLTTGEDGPFRYISSKFFGITTQ